MMTLLILASISSKLFVQYRLVYGQNGCDLATGIGCLACPNVFNSSGNSYPCYLLPTTTCAADYAATHGRDTTCYVCPSSPTFTLQCAQVGTPDADGTFSCSSLVGGVGVAAGSPSATLVGCEVSPQPSTLSWFGRVRSARLECCIICCSRLASTL
jgi:hypothetical protein